MAQEGTTVGLASCLGCCGFDPHCDSLFRELACPPCFCVGFRPQSKDMRFNWKGVCELPEVGAL